MASVTEDEQRHAEIKALLASAPSPLLQEPVFAACSAADPSSTLDRAPSGESALGAHSRAASVAHASAIQPSVSVLAGARARHAHPGAAGRSHPGHQRRHERRGRVWLLARTVRAPDALRDPDAVLAVGPGPTRSRSRSASSWSPSRSDTSSARTSSRRRRTSRSADRRTRKRSPQPPQPQLQPQPVEEEVAASRRVHNEQRERSPSRPQQPQQQGARASAESSVPGVAAFPPSPRTLELHARQSENAAHTAAGSGGGEARRSPSAGAPPVAAWNAAPGSVASALSPPLSPQHGSVGAAKSASTMAVPTGSNSGRRPKKRGSFSASTSTGPPAATSYSSGSGPIPFVEIQRGFRVVYRAFQDMDQDGSGGVDSEELKNALFAATNLKNDKEILEMRFKELDFDASGEVDLAEFVYAMTSWVGLMDEEDGATDDPTAMIK